LQRATIAALIAHPLLARRRKRQHADTIRGLRAVPRVAMVKAVLAACNAWPKLAPVPMVSPATMMRNSPGAFRVPMLPLIVAAGPNSRATA